MLEHKCEVCGRLWRKKLKADGKIVCNKHYKQFKKFGCFKDTSPRTQRDKNEIIIDGDVAYICLYDKQYNVIDKAIIDAEDVDKVKNIKWRKNCNGYVINNSKSDVFLHRQILGVDEMVDHRDGNRLNKRKENLRVCTKSTNQMNVDYKGIYERQTKDGISWISKIKINGKQLHLGMFKYKEEALYCRWFAEQLIFGEFAYIKEEPQIIESRKKEIQELVKSKVQRL